MSLMLVAFVALIWPKDKRQSPAISHENEGDLDDAMSGPHGEEIYIGAGGSRYFMKDGKKIYVGYKSKKSHL